MSGTDYQALAVDRHGAVLRVTLNRPERHNALSDRLMEELHEVISTAERGGETSVLVLRGAGRSFCSGYDVSPSDTAALDAQASPLERAQAARRDVRIFDRLWRSHIPSIAQVHGYCLAGGTDLALCCDLIVCATDATIGYPAVRSMGTPTTHMWLYHLGAQWTKRLLLTGDSISGRKAAELGLALEAVDPASLDQHVLDLATRMSWIPRHLLAANKSVVNRGLDMMGRTLLQETALTQEVLVRCAPSTDTFWKTAAQDGLKQAIAERDARFAAEDPIA